MTKRKGNEDENNNNNAIKASKEERESPKLDLTKISSVLEHLNKLEDSEKSKWLQQQALSKTDDAAVLKVLEASIDSIKDKNIQSECSKFFNQLIEKTGRNTLYQPSMEMDQQGKPGSDVAISIVLPQQNKEHTDKSIHLSLKTSKDYFLDGKIDFELSKYESASKNFSEAIKYDKQENSRFENQNYLYWLGKAYIARGRFEEAIETFTDTLNLSNQNSILEYLHGIETSQENELEPKDCVGFRKSMGQAYFGLGKKDKALKEFQEARNLEAILKIDQLATPFSSEVPLGKQEDTLPLPDDDEENPNDFSDLSNLDNFLDKITNEEEKFDFLRNVMDENLSTPDMVDKAFIIANVDLRLRDLDLEKNPGLRNKVEVLLSQLPLQINDEILADLVADELCHHGQPEESDSINILHFQSATKYVDQAIKLNPKNPLHHHTKGVILRKQKLLKEAIEESEKAIKLNTEIKVPFWFTMEEESIKYLIELADTYNEHCVFDKAISIYGEAIPILERLIPLYVNRHIQIELLRSLYETTIKQGVTYMNFDKLESAKSAFLKAIELSPNKGSAHFQLGKLLLKSGEPVKALKEFEQSDFLDLPRAFEQMVKNSNEDSKRSSYNFQAITEVFEEFSKAFKLLGQEDKVTICKDFVKHLNEHYHIATADEFGKFSLKLGIASKVVYFLDTPLNKSEFWIRVGDAYSALEKNVAAKNCYEKAIGVNPNNASVQSKLEKLSTIESTLSTEELELIEQIGAELTKQYHLAPHTAQANQENEHDYSDSSDEDTDMGVSGANDEKAEI